jgi:hypothetical protein
MSGTRISSGKITKVDLQGKTIEEWCKYEIGPLAEGIPPGMSYYDYYLSECEDFENYIFNFSENTIWEIDQDVNKAAYEDLEIYHVNDDGSISFTAVFYDGGTCIQEILREYVEDNCL